MPSVLVNGVSYAYNRLGVGEPLVLLHGFTGSRQSWSSVLDQLAAHAQVTFFDLLGHGETTAPIDVSRYAFDTAVDDLALAAKTIGIGRATWLGYSLGGRLALGMTLRHPELVSALVLESTSPGICDPDSRLERQRLDDELAVRIEARGIHGFVDEWESLPLWQSQNSLSPEIRLRQRHIRLSQNEVGLANGLRGMGQGSQPSLWRRLREIEIPVLMLAGELDPKYVGIVSAMARSLETATLAVVPEAGHTIHLEAPHIFCDLVLDFLARNESKEREPEVEEAE